MNFFDPTGHYSKSAVPDQAVSYYEMYIEGRAPNDLPSLLPANETWRDAVDKLLSNNSPIYNYIKGDYTKGNEVFAQGLMGLGMGGGVEGGELESVMGREILEGAAKTVELPSASFTASKLQHEFKHAGDFGVTGNWNKATGEAYQKAIQNHIDTATDVYRSTYRGQDVNVYINKSTGVGAYTDLSGNYIGGWKFSPDQMNFHLTNGTKIK
jgi:hypothetical protein